VVGRRRNESAYGRWGANGRESFLIVLAIIVVLGPPVSKAIEHEHDDEHDRGG
jgi:hypothetical protein